MGAVMQRQCRYVARLKGTCGLLYRCLLLLVIQKPRWREVVWCRAGTLWFTLWNTPHWHRWHQFTCSSKSLCYVLYERVPYLSALEVCSGRGAIQIHVYLTFTLHVSHAHSGSCRVGVIHFLAGWCTRLLNQALASLDLVLVVICNFCWCF